jgi:hypothetical protein
MGRKKACRQNEWCLKERAHPTMGELKAILTEQLQAAHRWEVGTFNFVEEQRPQSGARQADGGIEQWIVGSSSNQKRGATKRSSGKLGSMDYLVRVMANGTSSCCDNPYISAFVTSPFVEVFLKDPLYRLSFNTIHAKHLRKELSEAWAVTEVRQTY